MKMKAYTRKIGEKKWKRAKDLDDLPLAEWGVAILSAKVHKAEVKWEN